MKTVTMAMMSWTCAPRLSGLWRKHPVTGRVSKNPRSSLLVFNRKPPDHIFVAVDHPHGSRPSGLTVIAGGAVRFPSGYGCVVPKPNSPNFSPLAAE